MLLLQLKRSKLNLLIVTTNMSCIEEGLGEEGSKIREDDGKEDLGECNMSVLIQVLKRKDDRSLKMKVRMRGLLGREGGEREGVEGEIGDVRGRSSYLVSNLSEGNITILLLSSFLPS